MIAVVVTENDVVDGVVLRGDGGYLIVLFQA